MWRDPQRSGQRVSLSSARRQLSRSISGMASPTGGTSATNPFEVVTPQSTPTNKRPRPEELLDDKSKKAAHEEDLKDIFKKLRPTLEVLEQEIRSLLQAEKSKHVSEDELTSNLRRMLVHTESATRKSSGLRSAVTHAGPSTVPPALPKAPFSRLSALVKNARAFGALFSGPTSVSAASQSVVVGRPFTRVRVRAVLPADSPSRAVTAAVSVRA
ncbi:unnamed protein product [Bemisia tabaci]|uniref:Uncharacterized protein n=1 Tax=Bemisia tabaci TaxID=7038 RepID=A0A9P0A2L5_BEMTA|nr:unnamed protein product [Bemisia tabaci]